MPGYEWERRRRAQIVELLGGEYRNDRYVTPEQLQEELEIQKMNDNMLIGRPERDRYNDHLSSMYAEERLTPAEFNERSTQVASARTLADLKATVTSLPAIPEPAAPVVVPKGEFYSQRLNDAAKLAGKVHPAMWSFLAFLTSLGIAISVPVFNASAAHGFGHIQGGAAVLSILAIVLGSIVALVSGVFACFFLADA